VKDKIKYNCIRFFFAQKQDAGKINLLEVVPVSKEKFSNKITKSGSRRKEKKLMKLNVGMKIMRIIMKIRVTGCFA
jgi:NAD dependent epimerase/dehydratase family enzyme